MVHMRIPLQLAAALFLPAIVLGPPALAADPAPTGAPAALHDRAFWQSIHDHAFTVPPGESAIALATELVGYAGSPDRELRDGLAYEITASWVYEKKLFTPQELRALVHLDEANLTAKIGEVGTESVLARSFSALNLSVLAALDNDKPYLEKAEFDSLLDDAISYLAEERDLRGYDTKLGWVHSAAHTADLLKFLARNRNLAPRDQQRILDAISAKMPCAPDGSSTGARTSGSHGRSSRLRGC